MATIFTHKRLLLAALGILLINIPVSAQNWDNIQPLDVLPETAPWRSRDDVLLFSEIKADPQQPANNILYINDYSGLSRRGSYRYDWQRTTENGFADNEVNEETGITIVCRSKPTTQSINYEGYAEWMYISVRASGKVSFQTDIRWKRDTLELMGSTAYFPGGPSIYHQMLGDTAWHTFRITVKKQDVMVYIDEDPSPVITGKTYGTDVGADHLRIGKQNRDNPYGGQFDYFLILEGAIYPPGTGPAIPDGFIVGSNYPPVSVKEIEEPSGFSVYPNPAGDSMALKFIHESTGEAIIEIYSLAGQKIMTPLSAYLPAGEQQIQINTAALKTGIYLLSVNGKFTRFVKK